jgi:hypothetical protein
MPAGVPAGVPEGRQRFLQVVSGSCRWSVNDGSSIYMYMHWEHISVNEINNITPVNIAFMHPYYFPFPSPHILSTGLPKSRTQSLNHSITPSLIHFRNQSHKHSLTHSLNTTIPQLHNPSTESVSE